MCHQSYFCLLDIPSLCNTRHIFHRRVWYRMLSLRYARIRSSAIILIHQAIFVPILFSFAARIAELAYGENHILNHSITHSLILFDAPGTEAKKARQIINTDR